MIHYRDGHNSNALTTDFDGVANFNETFPLFNWYVVEADSTRYKTTGIHTVYDAGGLADGSASCGIGTTARACGTSASYNFLANTLKAVPLPADLSVPARSIVPKRIARQTPWVRGRYAETQFSTVSTGRIDPPWVVDAEGFSGMTSQGNFIEFGKARKSERGRRRHHAGGEGGRRTEVTEKAAPAAAEANSTRRRSARAGLCSDSIYFTLKST